MAAKCLFFVLFILKAQTDLVMEIKSLNALISRLIETFLKKEQELVW